MDDWYEPENFKPGDIYVDAEGVLTLEYAGMMTAKASRSITGGAGEALVDADDDAELVLVFIDLTAGDSEVRFYTHTKSDADRGYGFVSLADRIEDCCTAVDDRDHASSVNTLRD